MHRIIHNIAEIRSGTQQILDDTDISKTAVPIPRVTPNATETKNAAPPILPKSMEQEIQDRLPRVVQNQILSFLSIGTKGFTPRDRTFKVRGEDQIRFPTFLGNLFVLCSYMDRAQLTTTIAINLLHHIKVEETLALADQNKKCLPIPVLIKDPHGTPIDATPLQAVYAAGDRNPPRDPREDPREDAEPFGLVERVSLCFENPAHADKQLAEWKRDSQKATEKTMAPYIAAINNTCQQIIECKEIAYGIYWENALNLPTVLKLQADFWQALRPNPNHVVRSGFLFSMEIFLHMIETFRANVDNDNVEDKSRPNLGGWYSRKTQVLNAIVYPKLQARSQWCDLSIFRRGIDSVSKGRMPERLDFTAGPPEVIKGLGTTHYFSLYGHDISLGYPSDNVRELANNFEVETYIRQKHQ